MRLPSWPWVGQSCHNLARLAILAILCSLAGGFALAETEAFRLMPDTSVRIVVVEWMAAEGEYKEWTALSGDYRVSQDGRLSVPLIGDLDAQGHTTQEISILLADRLQAITGLSVRPVASVQVVEFPPVFVTGEVDRPGAVAFSPGLTVGRMMALAGGRARSADRFYRDPAQDRIRYGGELERLDLQRIALLAQLARLNAEQGDRDQILFPADLTEMHGSEAAATAMQLEDALFDARHQAQERNLASLRDLETLLQQEIGVLDEKMAVQSRQIEVSKEELARIQKLVSQGTAVITRQTSLDRILADLESSFLDMVLASMRAKQDLNEARRDAISLVGQRQAEVGRDLQTAQNALATLLSQRWTTQQLLLAVGADAARQGDLKAQMATGLAFTLVRSGAGAPRAVNSDEILMPGDLIDVAVAAPPLRISDTSGDSTASALLSAQREGE